jgi:hypothetical protein
MVSHTQSQRGRGPPRVSCCTALMSPRRSACASFAGLPTGSRRCLVERSRCRRRALVHARHVRARPSLVRAESLKAALDNVFSHSGQVFLAIMFRAVPHPTSAGCHRCRLFSAVHSRTGAYASRKRVMAARKPGVSFAATACSASRSAFCAASKCGVDSAGRRCAGPSFDSAAMTSSAWAARSTLSLAMSQVTNSCLRLPSEDSMTLSACRTSRSVAPASGAGTPGAAE